MNNTHEIKFQFPSLAHKGTDGFMYPSDKYSRNVGIGKHGIPLQLYVFENGDWVPLKSLRLITPVRGLSGMEKASLIERYGKVPLPTGSYDFGLDQKRNESGIPDGLEFAIRAQQHENGKLTGVTFNLVAPPEKKND